LAADSSIIAIQAVSKRDESLYYETCPRGKNADLFRGFELKTSMKALVLIQSCMFAILIIQLKLQSKNFLISFPEEYSKCSKI
jgi:hypothetical protein